jgi:hypothetical protein
MAGKPVWPGRAGWLAVAVVPPAAALAVWRQAASHQVSLAAALSVAYVTVVVIVRFTGGVIGDLGARWQKRVADYADLALQRRISRFDRRYRTWVLAGLRLDRTHAFGLSLKLALSLNRYLALEDRGAVSCALDLNPISTVDRARSLDLTFSRDRDPDLVLDLAFNRDLRRALTVDHGQSSGRDLAHSRANNPAPLLNHVVAIRCSRVMGTALSPALAKAMNSREDASNWAKEFSTAFAEVAGISNRSYLVDPNTLSQRLTHSVEAFRDTPAAHGPADESSWPVRVSRHLLKAAIPVFDRQEQLTRSSATAIRLAALCLAVEADVANQGKSAEELRTLAAGITFLERRTSGDDPATETIILASD